MKGIRIAPSIPLILFLVGCVHTSQNNGQDLSYEPSRIIPVSVIVDVGINQRLEKMNYTVQDLISKANQSFTQNGLNFEYQLSDITIFTDQELEKFLEEISRRERLFLESIVSRNFFAELKELSGCSGFPPKVKIYVLSKSPKLTLIDNPEGMATRGGIIGRDLCQLPPNGYGEVIVFSSYWDYFLNHGMRFANKAVENPHISFNMIVDTIAHEQGHLFGLDHDFSAENIMYRRVQTRRIAKMRFSKDQRETINGVLNHSSKQ